MSAQLRAGADQVLSCWSEGLARARSAPLGPRDATAVVFLAGIAADTMTTCALGLVPGLVEANPVAAAAMGAVGGPQVYMSIALLLLAPLTVLLAGRPRGLVAWGAWISVAAVGAIKLGFGAHNALLIAHVLTR